MNQFYDLISSLHTAKAGQINKRMIAARSVDGAMLGLCIGLSIYICIAIPMLVNQAPPAAIHALYIWLLSGGAIPGALGGAYLGWHRENQRLRRFHQK